MHLQFTLAPTASQKADYFRIRETCFRRDLQLEGFDGREDRWDGCSNLLIALDGSRCIGGVRISGRSAPSDTHMPSIPLETHSVPLPELLPDLALDGKSYCQPTRLAIDPRYRQPEVLNAMTRAMVTGSAALNYTLCVAVAGMGRSRLYRRIFHVCGYRYEIFEGVEVPAEPGFSDLPHVLSLGFLAGRSRAQEKTDVRRAA